MRPVSVMIIVACLFGYGAVKAKARLAVPTHVRMCELDLLRFGCEFVAQYGGSR